MLELCDITLSRGTQTLIQDANARVHTGQRVGLTGKNGCGKSTLLALIRGDIDADQGELLMPESWHIASVKQETPALAISALDYVLAGHQPFIQAQQMMSKSQAQDDGMLIARAHEAFAAADGYALPARAASLLSGLGFRQEQHQQAVSQFSGGWRMRLNLAQALLAPADILLLDEPTNHLDLDALIWLQDFLRQHQVTQIIIAHDRDFLDALCQQIWHIEHHSLQIYRGNYSQFERQHHERIMQADAQYQKEAARRAHLQSYIDRFRAKATKAKQAQSRLKALEKLNSAPPPPPEYQYRLQFSTAENLPNPLLRLEHVDVGYDKQIILKNIHLTFTNDIRIGLLGRNGAGKSTLMKLLANALPPLAGEYQRHPHTSIGYFTQHQLDALIQEDSALQHLGTLKPGMSEQAQRNYLGGYGFRGEDAEQPVKYFSGGEKARLALALIIAQKPNLLLLDEPTNHLDIGMRDALTEALQAFNGGMVIISHDRSLLRATCNEFYLVDKGKVTLFTGDLEDYHQYLLTQHKNKLASEHNRQSDPSFPPSRQQQKREAAEKRRTLQPFKKALNQAEKEMSSLQEKLAQIEHALADSSLYEEAAKTQLLTLLSKQAKLKKLLQQAEQNWLTAAEALELAEQKQ